MTARACLSALAAAALLALPACGKKAAVKSQVTGFEKAFQVTVPQSGGHFEKPVFKNALPAEANERVELALAAIRQNDYGAGVVALQTVQQVPRLSADQLAAVHSLMQAVTADLVERAGRGDREAKAQLAAIERTRSQ
jgi:hypothetical protein